MRLNHVTIGVTEMERSVAFYKNLGLKQIVADHPHYARFVCPDGDSTLSLQRLGPEIESFQSGREQALPAMASA